MRSLTKLLCCLSILSSVATQCTADQDILITIRDILVSKKAEDAVYNQVRDQIDQIPLENLHILYDYFFLEKIIPQNANTPSDYPNAGAFVSVIHYASMKNRIMTLDYIFQKLSTSNNTDILFLAANSSPLTPQIANHSRYIKYFGSSAYELLSPLHYAAEMGYIEVAKTLIKYGARIDVQGKKVIRLDNGKNNPIFSWYWCTPLYMAAKGKQGEVAYFLVTSGASLTAKTSAVATDQNIVDDIASATFIYTTTSIPCPEWNGSTAINWMPNLARLLP